MKFYDNLQQRNGPTAFVLLTFSSSYRCSVVTSSKYNVETEVLTAECIKILGRNHCFNFVKTKILTEDS